MAKGGNGGGGNGGLPKITGKNNKDDLLIGTGVAELIKGLSGNDTLIGGGGDDILDGGNDYDTVVYDGSVFGYAIDIAAGTITDTDLSDGDDGSDTLIGVEQVNFGDATVYFDGTNNNPLIAGSVNTGSVTELIDGDPGENSFLHNASGTIDFLEFDRTSSNTVNVVAAGAGYLGVLTAQFSDADTSDGAGQITWSFDVEDADINHLAAGETLVQSYDVTIDDGQGGSTTETIMVTLNGSNDAPTQILLSQNLVLENSTNQAIGLLSAVDLDSSGPVTFSIVPGLDGDLFEIINGELMLGSTPLDYEYMSTRTVTIRATDADGAFYDQDLTIEVVDSVVEVLTTGADSNAGTAYDTLFQADATTLNPEDSLIATDGTYDTMLLNGSGTYDFASMVNFSGFDQIIVQSDSLDPIQLIMNDDIQLNVMELLTVGDTTTWFSEESTGAFQFYGGQGSDVVHLGTQAAVAEFFGGAGDDAVYLNQSWGIQYYDGGSGDDLLHFSSSASWAGGGEHPTTDLIDGGAGLNDVLSFGGPDQYVVENVNIMGFEELLLAGTGYTHLIVGQDIFDDVLRITSDQTDAKLISYMPTLDLRGIAVTGVSLESSDGVAVEFVVDDKQVALQVYGGSASYQAGQADDVIAGSGFTFTAGERQSIFDNTLVEVVSDDSGIYGNDMLNVLVADAGGGIIDGGGFSDELYGGAGDDTFVFAAGDSTGAADYVYNFEAGAGSNDVIDLQAYGSVAAQTAIDTAIELTGSTLLYFQDSDDTIVLDGVLLASLHAEDFLV